MNICTLFNKLDSNSNYFTFSQYSEDITKNINNSSYNIIPSKFICINLFEEGDSDSGVTDETVPEISSNTIIPTIDFNEYIPQILQNYYENFCSVMRNNNIDHNYYLQKLLDALKLIDSNVVSNIKCIEDINMFSSSDIDGNNYHEIYCYISPNTCSKSYEQNFDSYISYSNIESDNIISGYESESSRYSSDIFPLQYSTIADLEYNYNYASDDQGLLSVVSENSDELKFIFNTVIILYNVQDNDGNIIYENRPLGIYFTGEVEDSTIQNEYTKYVNNGDIYGQGTSYGLRICNRLLSTANSTSIMATIENESFDGVSVYANAISQMSKLTNSIKDRLEGLNINSTSIKESLQEIQNDKTNVPYIKQIMYNGSLEYLWFVNGWCTGVKSTGNSFNLLGTIIDNDWPVTGSISDYVMDEDGNLYKYEPYSGDDSEDLDDYGDKDADYPIWLLVGNISGSKGDKGETGDPGYSLNIQGTLEANNSSDDTSTNIIQIESTYTSSVPVHNDTYFVSSTDNYFRMFVYEESTSDDESGNWLYIGDLLGATGAEGTPGAGISPQSGKYSFETFIGEINDTNFNDLPNFFLKDGDTSEFAGLAYNVDGKLYVIGKLSENTLKEQRRYDLYNIASSDSDVYSGVTYSNYSEYTNLFIIGSESYGDDSIIPSEWTSDYESITDTIVSKSINDLVGTYAYINMGDWQGAQGETGDTGGYYKPTVMDGKLSFEFFEDGDIYTNDIGPFDVKGDTGISGVLQSINELPITSGTFIYDSTTGYYKPSEGSISSNYYYVHSNDNDYLYVKINNNAEYITYAFIVNKSNNSYTGNYSGECEEGTVLIWNFNEKEINEELEDETLYYQRTAVNSGNIQGHWWDPGIINPGEDIPELNTDLPYLTMTEKDSYGNSLSTVNLINIVPVSHASTGTGYGGATETEYGHIKLSNSIDDYDGSVDNKFTAITKYAAYEFITKINDAITSIREQTKS